MITLHQDVTDSVRLVKRLSALSFPVSRLSDGRELSGHLSVSTNSGHAGQQKAAAAMNSDGATH